MPTFEVPCPNCGQHMITVSVGIVVELLFVKYAIQQSSPN